MISNIEDCAWPMCYHCFPNERWQHSEMVKHFGHLKMHWLLYHFQTMNAHVELTWWPIMCSTGTWRLSDLDSLKLHFCPVFTLPNSPHWHLVLYLCVSRCVKPQESSSLEQFRITIWCIFICTKIVTIQREFWYRETDSWVLITSPFQWMSYTGLKKKPHHIPCGLQQKIYII